MSTLRYEIADKLLLLRNPARYKVLYGGRGGAKSWGVARELLVSGIERPLRILCAREFQRSIADSVHKLLCDQIEALGLQRYYEVLQNTIRGRNGTEFAFAGLHHNITGLKSFEGVDICWVEEAQTTSKSSWDTLIPTIRKENSEIWITFNPELETDETYQRFVLNPPTGAVVQKIDYRDNPWFPRVLEQERLDLKERDPDAYLNVWEGHCRTSLEGAIYAAELRESTERNRITNVPYDKGYPVDVYFDLGWADQTAIWFVQKVGFEFRLIDYYANSQKGIQHYLDSLQTRGYVYRTVFLPHDGVAKQLGTGKSIQEVVQAANFKVQIVPKLSLTDGINAARTIFHQCYFDAEKCSDGLQSLRHYRYDVDRGTGQFSRIPLHDEHSHAADAFRYFAVGSSPSAAIKHTEHNWRKKLDKARRHSAMTA